MSIPVIGIFIVAGITLLLTVFYAVLELRPRRHKDDYDEVPEGYWEELEKHLAERPKLPPEKGDDPEPLI
jgi:hypothetical protein